MSEQDLGNLLIEQDDSACLEHFEAHHDLLERIGDTLSQARAASSLGTTYSRVSGLRDLDKAQGWLQRSLKLTPLHDHVGRSAVYSELATVAFQRFQEGSRIGASPRELVDQIEGVRNGYQNALDLLPIDHHNFRSVVQNQLGMLHTELGDMQGALNHFQHAIRHKEASGDTFGAGRSR